MADTQISYKTVIEKPRTGWAGKLLRWMGSHPLLAGLVGGVAAVLIAAARAFEGVNAAPADAAILGAIVVIVWVVLFYFLRGFFTRQAIQRLEVRRDLQASDQRFCWSQGENGEEVLTDIESPHYTLYSTRVPEDMLEGSQLDQPWPVWLVVEGSGGRFALETKVTAGEASGYEKVDEELIEAADEVLPTGLASPLLSCADRKPR